MKKIIIAIILAVFLVSVAVLGVTFGDYILAVVTNREIVDAYDDYPLQTKEQVDYSQLSEDKAVFMSENCQEYFDWISDIN
ncbi:MAG: hypothetical protein IKJ69_01420 [Clostridia bacterium]|nr:hypothetical protein [Clostridia bacterium]